MKHLPITLLCLLAAGAFAWAMPQEDGAPETGPTTEPYNPTFEYKAVGMVDMHGDALDYLKGALGEDGLLGKAKKADEQWAKKTEDLCNELGAEGWELAHATGSMMIFKRRTGRY